MAKTELTKKIEAKLSTYRPKELGDLKINYMRDQYDMYEVPVTHGTIQNGLIDYVWIAEGFRNTHKEPYCFVPKILKSSLYSIESRSCTVPPEMLTEDSYNEDCCNKCHFASYSIVQDDIRAVICFEIKVSKADFYSGHGQNFIGNLNYFVMPIDLYKEIADQIPPKIGCIVFSDKGKQEILRKKKDAIWQNIDESTYSELLLTAINKYRKKWSKQLSDYRLKESAHLNIIDSLIHQNTLLHRKYDFRPTCYKPTELTELQQKYPQIYEMESLICSQCDSNNADCVDCLYNNQYEYQYKQKHNLI